ncbi:MAG: hypothetical protein M1326_02970 [Cyanobacteria bacterium]|nr:hypothetical protein [Cyanobacteriota bacterium]
MFSVGILLFLLALMAALMGCSLERFAFNFKHRISNAMNFNEKQKSRKESNFKNKNMFKQNNENIPLISIYMSQTAKDVKSVLANTIIVRSPGEKAGNLSESYFS